MFINNILYLVNGGLIIVLLQDIVLGFYYLLIMVENELGEGMVFFDIGEIYYVLVNKVIMLYIKIKGWFCFVDEDGNLIFEIFEIILGWMLIVEFLLKYFEVLFDVVNKLMIKKDIFKMIDMVYCVCGQKEMVIFCDWIMQFGFKNVCNVGIFFGMDDMVILDIK